MMLVMQASRSLDGCSQPASLHHPGAVIKLSTQQSRPACVCVCVSVCVLVCVCVCVCGGGLACSGRLPCIVNVVVFVCNGVCVI